MKAVRSIEGGVAVVDLDVPPGAGELLRVRATSVCGSDLSYIRFGSRQILGHELAGVREDGTAVVVEAIYGCMECAPCLRGEYNLCPTHGQRALGITADGGMAEQFRAPAARLVPLPTGLDVRDASIVEPASVSWHALRLAGAGRGKRVAVVGAGAPVQLDWAPLFHREARLIPSLGYCAHDGGREMDEAAAMLADDPDVALTVITHRFPIEDATEAFRVASDKTEGAIRVVIEPS